jgi:hypothetical protein
MAISLALLLWLHGRLDGLLDVQNQAVLEPRLFRTLHREYLWISTTQWALCVGYMVMMLYAWQHPAGYEEHGNDN